jgi:hypothetical protein
LGLEFNECSRAPTGGSTTNVVTGGKERDDVPIANVPFVLYRYVPGGVGRAACVTARGWGTVEGELLLSLALADTLTACRPGG